MKVYKPIHTGKWEIWELDTDNLKRIGNGHTVTDYKEGVGHYGTCYTNEFFKNRESAEKWINKEYFPCGDIIRL